MGELAAPFDLTMPAISKHLSVLERAGLLTKSRDGQRRNCRITATPLRNATSWLNEYRRHWEANLETLDSYLDRIQRAQRTWAHKPGGTAMSTTAPPRAPAAPPSKATIEYPADNELIIRRDFQAPRELVFAAISQPEHVRQWYGMSCDGLLVCDIDFRVGGRWHYVLAGPPDEEDAFVLRGVPGDRSARNGSVSTESYDNMPGASYQVDVTLTEQDGVTTLQNHLVYPSQEWRDGHVDSGMAYGMNISYDRLEALLERLSGSAG